MRTEATEDKDTKSYLETGDSQFKLAARKLPMALSFYFLNNNKEVKKKTNNLKRTGFFLLFTIIIIHMSQDIWRIKF